MAKIKHFFRKEDVYEKCDDRGLTFHAWVKKDVEHFCCSACSAEVNKDSVFCSKCGEKFTGISEERKTCVCEICGSKFKQMEHENATYCPNCRSLLYGRYGAEIAKVFYELGKQQARQN